MAIRFLLVTLVAAMGFEPPTRDEVSCWTRSGQVWIAARIDDWSITTAQRAQDANDKAFRSVVETMSRDFSRDLAAMNQAKPKVETRLAFEQIEVLDTLETGVAFALNREQPIEPARASTESIAVADALDDGAAFAINRESDGLSNRFIEAEPVLIVAAKPETQVASSIESEADEQPMESRTAKLSSALSLTRQALSAWASVLNGSNAVVRR